MPTPPPNHTLWVDVSTLLAWEGTPTGISRTLAQLVEQWLQEPQLNLRLCRFHPAGSCFTEVDAATVQAVLARSRTARCGLPAPSPAAAAQPSRLTAARRALWQFLKRRADLLSPRTRAFLKRALGACNRRRRAAFAYVRRHLAWPPPPQALTLTAGDVLLSSGFSWDLPGYTQQLWFWKQRDRFQFVPLVYDLTPSKVPQFFGPGLQPRYEAWLADTLWAADLVLTISDNSRRDIEWFARTVGTPQPPIAVFRLGDEVGTDSCPLPWLRHGVATPVERFILSVGTIEGRKNHLVLYHVWRQLLAKHGETVPNLVLVGRPGWLTHDLLYQVANDPVTAGKIVLLHDVSDPELTWLYQHCLFTLYPSHYEGWGLPIAESLAHGRYCIAAHAGSLPEIAGDLIDYHEPMDVAACTRLVSRAAFDESYRADREARIRARYRKTTWTQCARAVRHQLELRFGAFGTEEKYREAVA